MNIWLSHGKHHMAKLPATYEQAVETMNRRYQDDPAFFKRSILYWRDDRDFYYSEVETKNMHYETFIELLRNLYASPN